MKKIIYIVVAVVIVLVVAVLWYMKAGSQASLTAQTTGYDQFVDSADNLALVGMSNDNLAESKEGSKFYNPKVMKIYKSIIYPIGDPRSTDLSADKYLVNPNLKKGSRDGWDSAWAGRVIRKVPGEMSSRPIGELMVPTSICKNPISAWLGQKIQNSIDAAGGNAKVLTSDSRRYVSYAEHSIGYQSLVGIIAQAVEKKDTGKSTMTYPYTLSVPIFGYCLDKDYVSNYPAYVANMGAFLKEYYGTSTTIRSFNTNPPYVN